MKDEAVDIVGEVGERDLRLGAHDADCADEQCHLSLLPGEHVLNADAVWLLQGLHPAAQGGMVREPHG